MSLVGAVQDGRVKAVVFDLDDTLYSQTEFLLGAFEKVADTGGLLSFSRDGLLRCLVEAASKGTDSGHVINDAIDAVVEQNLGPPWAFDYDRILEVFVDSFKKYRPERLDLYSGVVPALVRLRAHVPIGLLTDGDVGLQQAKIRALGLEGKFERIIITDDLAGRKSRKPAAVGFLAVLNGLHAVPSQAVMVGDRIDKDIQGSRRVGMHAIRVKTGEWSHVPTPNGVHEVPDVNSAVDLLLSANDSSVKPPLY